MRITFDFFEIFTMLQPVKPNVLWKRRIAHSQAWRFMRLAAARSSALNSKLAVLNPHNIMHNNGQNFICKHIPVLDLIIMSMAKRHRKTEVNFNKNNKCERLPILILPKQYTDHYMYKLLFEIKISKLFYHICVYVMQIWWAFCSTASNGNLTKK